LIDALAYVEQRIGIQFFHEFRVSFLHSTFVNGIPTLSTFFINHSQAQTWVDKMSVSDPDEPNDKDFEGRLTRYIHSLFFLAFLDNCYVCDCKACLGLVLVLKQHLV
jgi:hypothetical protein